MTAAEFRKGRVRALDYLTTRRLLRSWERVRDYLDRDRESPTTAEIDREFRRAAAKSQAKLEAYLFATGLPIRLASPRSTWWIRLDTLTETLEVERRPRRMRQPS